jgi:hypothetical protein
MSVATAKGSMVAARFVRNLRTANRSRRDTGITYEASEATNEYPGFCAGRDSNQPPSDLACYFGGDGFTDEWWSTIIQRSPSLT